MFDGSKLSKVVKTDGKSLGNALVAGIVGYFAADALFQSKTVAQINDMIDDVVTAKIAEPVADIISKGGSTSFAGIAGIGAVSYLEIGNRVANYIAPIPTVTVGGQSIANSTALPSTSVLSASKIAVGAVVGLSSIIDFGELSAILGGK